MPTVVASSTARGSALRVFAYFGSMTAWFLHLNISYLLVPWSCRWNHVWFLHLATVALAGVAAGSLFAAWRLYNARPGEDLPEGRPAVRTGPFLGLYGVVLGGIFLLAILLGGIGNLVIDPCAK
jgi:hypothetical protein